MRPRFCSGIVPLVVLASAATAAADGFVEVGDAGFTLPTAQVTRGNGLVTSIAGTFGNNPATNPPPFNNPFLDPDIYQIYIDGGGNFSATTVGQPGTVFDTALYLFDSRGFGVYANDDEVGGRSFRSTLSAGTPLTPRAAGFYYLLVAPVNFFPTDDFGNEIFPLFPQRAVYGPTGPGGGSPFTNYNGFFAEEVGTYTVALTGARFAAAPEPPGWASLAVGVLAVLGLVKAKARRRRDAPDSAAAMAMAA